MAMEQDARHEEVWINSRKYMIPERTIRLDFLEKAADRRNPVIQRQPLPPLLPEDMSSSPLTSLSSLTDDEDRRSELADMAKSESNDASDAASSLLSVSENPRLYKTAPLSPSPNYSPRKHRGQSIVTLVKAALSDTSHGSISPGGGLLSSLSTDPIPGISSSTIATTASTSSSVRTPSPVTPMSESHVKAGSTATSFRIRLGRQAAAIVPSKPLTTNQAVLPDRSLTSELPKATPSPQPVAKSAFVISNGVAKSLTPQEIEQLLHVRALMMAKGEQRMLEFLTSD